MGRGENRLKKIQTAQNRLVTREHMIDYVHRQVRDEIGAYHSRFAPIFRWYQKRERRWYRRLWRWARSASIKRRRST